jgi:hypothetical protein
MGDRLPPQTREELEAHYGPDGPVRAAEDWLELVNAGDFDAVWRGMDETLRLAVAQDWIYANRKNTRDFPQHDWDRLAAHLSECPPRHTPRLSDFNTIMLSKFQAIGYDPDTWGAGSRPRPIGLDCELILFTEASSEPIVFNEPTFIETNLMLLMRSTPSGWLVAGFTDEPPVPGWPPQAGLGPRDEL